MCVAADDFFPTDYDGWGFGLSDGTLWHRGGRGREWVSASHWAQDPNANAHSSLGGQMGDRIRLTLDLRGSGTLTVHKNDMRLGVLASRILDQVRPGCGFCWMVQLSSVGQAVRIRRPRRSDAGTSFAVGRGGAGNRSMWSSPRDPRREELRQLPYRSS